MRRNVIGTVVIALLMVLGACSGGPETSEAPASDAAVTSHAEWVRLADGDLTDRQQELREHGKAAVRTMAKRLMGELHSALDERGPDGAIEVCSMRAPEIAANVSNEFGLVIGRTSFRLRNPSNVPPEWAETLVSEQVAEPVWLAGPDGAVAGMMPIRLKSECAMCHGPREQIADEVLATLDEMYPEDVATGFEEGDLRGWFWVEVPAST